MRDRSPIQTVAMLVGAVFLLVGILGFIPGITTNYDDLKFTGHSSDAQLLGIFDVSILHNIVHLLFGVAGLALARTYEGARNYLIGGGVIYLALSSTARSSAPTRAARTGSPSTGPTTCCTWCSAPG